MSDVDISLSDTCDNANAQAGARERDGWGGRGLPIHGGREPLSRSSKGGDRGTCAGVGKGSEGTRVHTLSLLDRAAARIANPTRRGREALDCGQETSESVVPVGPVVAAVAAVR